MSVLNALETMVRVPIRQRVIAHDMPAPYTGVMKQDVAATSLRMTVLLKVTPP